MSFTVHEEKQYEASPEAVYQAAVGAVGGLEGQLVRQDPSAGQLEAKFDKKILGKVLGDRTQMEVTVRPAAEQGTRVAVEVYPLDAIGRKLQFGARKGVSQTVVTWFFAHLEHRLK